MAIDFLLMWPFEFVRGIRPVKGAAIRAPHQDPEPGSVSLENFGQCVSAFWRHCNRNTFGFTVRIITYLRPSNKSKQTNIVSL